MMDSQTQKKATITFTYIAKKINTKHKKNNW